MGFPNGCSERVAKIPNAKVQCERLLFDLLTRIVPDTIPRGDTLIAK
jgi:hypothetical protein